MSIAGWVVLFELLAKMLSDRLQHPLDSGLPGAREIKQQFAYLHQLIREGRQDEARWQAIRLESFIHAWDVAAAAMPEFAAELRIRFIRDEQRSGYIGARAELAMAAALLEKGVHLKRGQPPEPDFLVERPEGTVTIECTAAHLGTARGNNFDKIEEAIRVKGDRDYCGPAAVLYVDYTAITFRGGDALDPAFHARTRAVVEDTRWGAVLLGVFMVASEGARYWNALARVDGRMQTPSLRALLASAIPHGENYLPLVSIPPTS